MPYLSLVMKKQLISQECADNYPYENYIQRKADSILNIAQWFGNVSTVPAGWHICNGTSGTPDLSLDTQARSGGTLYYIMKL